MARGDFRYTPHYQFWLGIAISVIWGAFVGWMVDDHGVLGGIGNIAFWMAFGVVIALIGRRFYGVQNARDVQPFEHPILGLYSGLANGATLVILEQAPTFAVLSGLVVAGSTVVLLEAIRRLRGRKPLNSHWKTPTITGWR